jgi:hypothetical protein
MVITELSNLRTPKQIAQLTHGAYSVRHVRYLIDCDVDAFRTRCCVRTRGRWAIENS